MEGTPVKQIACGAFHTAAIGGFIHACCLNQTDGRLSHRVVNGHTYTWGQNKYGELGRKGGDANMPGEVKKLADYFATSVSCGQFSTAICTGSFLHLSVDLKLLISRFADEGDVHIWGRLAGKHFTSHSSVPTFLAVPASRAVFSSTIACGDTHYAILQDGNLRLI